MERYRINTHSSIFEAKETPTVLLGGISIFLAYSRMSTKLKNL